VLEGQLFVSVIVFSKEALLPVKFGIKGLPLDQKLLLLKELHLYK